MMNQQKCRFQSRKATITKIIRCHIHISVFHTFYQHLLRHYTVLLEKPCAPRYQESVGADSDRQGIWLRGIFLWGVFMACQIRTDVATWMRKS